jgi:hypothetical protein
MNHQLGTANDSDPQTGQDQWHQRDETKNPGSKWILRMRVVKTLLVVSLASCLVQCQKDQARQLKASEAEAGIGTALKYPRGRWRLTPEKLTDVLLPVSHILIRHAESRQTDSALLGGLWQPDPSPRTSKQLALERAFRLSREAAENPERFAELAKSNSDDSVTKVEGGSLGTAMASFLPEEFLDVLATMKPGDVSRVVETPLGYHVLRLRAPTPELHVTAQRIVIGYRGASMREVRADRKDARSRDEARALARRLALEAWQRPDQFSKLVEEYSDHEDAATTEGRWGPWSTHRPLLYPRELESISRLAVGEVSELMDTHLGFVIFKRIDTDVNAPLAYSGSGRPAVFTLPTPDGPDLDYLVRNAEATALGKLVRSLRDKALSSLPLEGTERNHFAALLDQLATRLEKDAPDERITALHEFRREMDATFAPTITAEFRRMAKELVIHELLREPD